MASGGSPGKINTSEPVASVHAAPYAVLRRKRCTMNITPTLLLILDGFGLTAPGPGNAVSLARIPTLHRLLALPERSFLSASGLDVGLPKGFIGNSEVGHLNIGAGRVVYQDLTRIDLAVENGELGQNPAFLNLCAAVKSSRGRLHLLGLLSDAGVHSHIAHLKVLVQAAHAQGVPSVVHAFTDGRDTSPTSGAAFVEELLPVLAANNSRLGTLCGRFYAMDRDKRWERVHTAFQLLVEGVGEAVLDPVNFLKASYAADVTDEFIQPTVVEPAQGAHILSGDGLLFFNYRADRAREMVHAFVDEHFVHFPRGPQLSLAGLATMTSYEADLDVPVLFAKDNLAFTLGQVVSDAGLHQLRIAETEKYAHVTYFLNGGREEPFPLEDRILVPSPKEVATYDLKPAMSAPEVTDKLLAAWASGQYSLAVCNLANPDMVGHTGVLNAAIEACQVVDACVTRILDAVLASGGQVFITADHGNVEKMLDDAGKPYTAHTTNPTPFIALRAAGPVPLNPAGGRLADIAPTLLSSWGMDLPPAMTGHSLLSAVKEH